MTRRFVLATEVTEPAHFASELIYSPDRSTSFHINLLDCSACNVFFIARVALCFKFYVYLRSCTYEWPCPPCQYLSISSHRRTEDFLMWGVPCTSVTAAVWFSSDLGKGFRSSAAHHTLTKAIPLPAHLPGLISLQTLHVSPFVF